MLASTLPLGLLAGCGPGEEPPGPAPSVVQDIVLASIEPGTLLPGTDMVVTGAGFVPEIVGPSRLVLEGSFGGQSAHFVVDAAFVDYDRMSVAWPGGTAFGLSSDVGTLAGQAAIETDNRYDGLVHRSAPLPVQIEIRPDSRPRLDAVQDDIVFVNDPVVLVGDGFLLGGGEGETVAVVEGCFAKQGTSDCVPVPPAEVPCRPFKEFDRSRVVFPFSPRIAGIDPGSFTGWVKAVNRHGELAGSIELPSETLAATSSIIEPAIAGFAPPVASLGQYVDVSGGGFVGPEPGYSDASTALTTIELEGTFTPAGSGEGTEAKLVLVPEFVSGQLVRYVLNEEDQLGQSIDLRSVTGDFAGTARPVVRFGAATVTGGATNVSLGIAHVRQVVWVRFLPSYVESLRHFGLRAAEGLIRERAMAALRRDYGGLNAEFRAEPPADFALYAEVEISGPDPNGIGLLGYDNTPGKDTGNKRLYDKIGGINALTQQDGYPGYGGIFVESVFGFSEHPGAFATKLPGAADPAFDQLFDAFRADVGGTPVAAGELGAGQGFIAGDGCPAAPAARAKALGCAVWALGSVIGTVVAHELGHSLGLADPGGPAFHNDGDTPDALMDAGEARTFRERAEILSEGPGRFCQPDFDYLRSILPSEEPDPAPGRPNCY